MPLGNKWFNLHTNYTGAGERRTAHCGCSIATLSSLASPLNSSHPLGCQTNKQWPAFVWVAAAEIAIGETRQKTQSKRAAAASKQSADLIFPAKRFSFLHNSSVPSLVLRSSPQMQPIGLSSKRASEAFCELLIRTKYLSDETRDYINSESQLATLSVIMLVVAVSHPPRFESVVARRLSVVARLISRSALRPRPRPTQT